MIPAALPRVVPVLTGRDFAEFVELPLRLHPADRYVPVPRPTLRRWWTKGDALGRPVEFWLARDASGATVGRCVSHHDPRLDAKLGERLQLFGLCEFADATALGALTVHLDRRATDSDRAALLGPVNLLPNQSGGVITSGFADRGFVDSAWNPGHYPLDYAAHGYREWFPADTWQLPITTATVERSGGPPTPAEWRDAGLRIEYGSRRAIRRQLADLLVALNASFDQLPYYTEITPAELALATDGLAYLLDEKLLLLAYDDAGRVVAFVLFVPDLSLFLQRTGGRMGPLQLLRLLITRSAYRSEAIGIVQGTVPGLQGRGVITLLIRQLYANLLAGGYRRIRTTYIGRDNPASARQLTRVGGQPLHGYTFYRRPVTHPRSAR